MQAEIPNGPKKSTRRLSLETRVSEPPFRRKLHVNINVNNFLTDSVVYYANKKVVNVSTTLPDFSLFEVKNGFGFGFPKVK